MGGRSRTGANATVDRDALHRLLWTRVDRRGTLRLHQQRLADELAVTKFTVSRIVHEFLEQGRLVKVGSAKANVSTYRVVDPAAWTPT